MNLTHRHIPSHSLHIILTRFERMAIHVHVRTVLLTAMAFSGMIHTQAFSITPPHIVSSAFEVMTVMDVTLHSKASSPSSVLHMTTDDGHDNNAAASNMDEMEEVIDASMKSNDDDDNSNSLASLMESKNFRDATRAFMEQVTDMALAVRANIESQQRTMDVYQNDTLPSNKRRAVSLVEKIQQIYLQVEEQNTIVSEVSKRIAVAEDRTVRENEQYTAGVSKVQKENESQLDQLRGNISKLKDFNRREKDELQYLESQLSNVTSDVKQIESIQVSQQSAFEKAKNDLERLISWQADLLNSTERRLQNEMVTAEYLTEELKTKIDEQRTLARDFQNKMKEELWKIDDDKRRLEFKAAQAMREKEKRKLSMLSRINRMPTNYQKQIEDISKKSERQKERIRKSFETKIKEAQAMTAIEQEKLAEIEARLKAEQELVFELKNRNGAWLIEQESELAEIEIDYQREVEKIENKKSQMDSNIEKKEKLICDLDDRIELEKATYEAELDEIRETISKKERIFTGDLNKMKNKFVISAEDIRAQTLEARDDSRKAYRRIEQEGLERVDLKKRESKRLRRDVIGKKIKPQIEKLSLENEIVQGKMSSALQEQGEIRICFAANLSQKEAEITDAKILLEERKKLAESYQTSYRALAKLGLKKCKQKITNVFKRQRVRRKDTSTYK
mmetsp:Transcript_13387/g.17527  ORF Transcript_13387/g.17527 Transcript_13387/m.17527 type:complete len:677 (-) Transcript_13387:135-2165(-)